MVIFLVFITSSLQYLVQSLTYKTDIKRIEQVISNAKLAAWGPKRIPVEGKRKASFRYYLYAVVLIVVYRSRYLLVVVLVSMRMVIHMEERRSTWLLKVMEVSRL